MDLSQVKVGDKVYSILRNWEGKVVRYYRTPELDGLESCKVCGNPEITDWKPKKREWKPKLTKKKTWCLSCDGMIDRYPSEVIIDETKEGRVYNTEKQAEYAYKTIRACQILNAYVAKLAPEWRADWNDNTQEKWFVQCGHIKDIWYADYESTLQSFERVHMSKACAKQLRDDLNNGIVKL